MSVTMATYTQVVNMLTGFAESVKVFDCNFFSQAIDVGWGIAINIFLGCFPFQSFDENAKVCSHRSKLKTSSNPRFSPKLIHFGLFSGNAEASPTF